MPGPSLQQPRIWIALFVLYVTVQAAVRIGLGDAMNVDEAEAWLWAQHLDWGYGPQPPLYIWAQRAVFMVTGPGVVGLAGLKALTLLAIALLAFGIARRWVTPERAGLAGLAVAALLWLPELSWESQRIRTHNVMTSGLALAALWQVLRLRDDPRGRNFVLLGVIFGLGLLSKWNFGLLVPGFLAALWAAPGGRAVLMRARVAWLAVLPAVMVAPTLIWMLTHPEVAFASFDKLGLDAAPSRMASALQWLGAVGSNTASFAALPVLALGGLALTTRRRTAEGLAPAARVEMRMAITVAAVAFALMVLAGIAGGATQLRARWLLPVLLPAFPALALWVLARSAPRARRVFAGLTAGLAIMLILAIGAMLRFDPPMKNDPVTARIATLPDAAPGEPVIGKVEVIANLQARLPDRLLRDQALAMAGDCPASVWVLDPGAALSPGLAAWLAGCGLQAGAETPAARRYARP